jgi:hypothetical protein
LVQPLSRKVSGGRCDHAVVVNGACAQSWLECSHDGGQMRLVKHKRSIPLHFRRNSLCAYGGIRMFSSQSDAKGCEPAHVRAVNLGPSLANLGRGWVRLSEDVIAV